MLQLAAAALIAAGTGAPAAVPAPARQPAAAAPKVPAPVPVPRTDFIQTMDAEFGKMDADKNKVVTKAEVEQSLRAAAALQARARVRALFNALDSDKNGQLSAGEFDAMAAVPPAPNANPVLAEADLDKDGRITLVEYRTEKLANFDRMDADKDGIVSIAEMKAAGLVK